MMKFSFPVRRFWLLDKQFGCGFAGECRFRYLLAGRYIERNVQHSCLMHCRGHRSCSAECQAGVTQITQELRGLIQDANQLKGRIERPIGKVVEDWHKQHAAAQTQRCEEKGRQKNGDQHHNEGVHVSTYMASMTMAMPWPPPMQAVATP